MSSGVSHRHLKTILILLAIALDVWITGFLPSVNQAWASEAHSPQRQTVPNTRTPTPTRLTETAVPNTRTPTPPRPTETTAPNPLTPTPPSPTETHIALSPTPGPLGSPTRTGAPFPQFSSTPISSFATARPLPQSTGTASLSASPSTLSSRTIPAVRTAGTFTPTVTASPVAPSTLVPTAAITDFITPFAPTTPQNTAVPTDAAADSAMPPLSRGISITGTGVLIGIMLELLGLLLWIGRKRRYRR